MIVIPQTHPSKGVQKKKKYVWKKKKYGASLKKESIEDSVQKNFQTNILQSASGYILLTVVLMVSFCLDN